MNQIYISAIELWVHEKQKDEDFNPSDGIIFAVTDRTRPEDIPEPTNTVELCEAISEIAGLPPLSQDDKDQIQIEGVEIYMASRSGGGSIKNAQKILGFHWFGIILGVIALIAAKFSRWTFGLVIWTHWSFGATRVCAQKQNTNPGPSWKLPAHIFIHLASLTALIGISAYHLYLKFM